MAAKIKGIGASPGLDSSQVAHVLGDGRGCHADLVVAQMETNGIGRIDFYEVGDVLDCFAVYDNVEVAIDTFVSANVFNLPHTVLRAQSNVDNVRSSLSASPRVAGLKHVDVLVRTSDVWTATQRHTLKKIPGISYS